MTDSSKNEDTLIIGAGMAGLFAAHKLKAAGVDPLILDKGRGVGGRMATRRIDSTRFDHGAQFFTVRGATFRAHLYEWLADDIARQWSDGFPGISGKESVGHPRYRGAEGMTSIAKYLARGLRVETGTRVAIISSHNGTWRVGTDDGRVYYAHALVMTPPVPQTVTLLKAGEDTLPSDISDALTEIEYDPCIAVMAVTAGPSRIPDPGGMAFDDNILYWVADNHKKGISPDGYGVTIHTTSNFSREWWDKSDDDISRHVFQRMEREFGTDWSGKKVVSFHVHRWRYSMPTVLHPEPFLFTPDPAPIVFAGDAFGGPKIEDAALSGIVAGEKLTELITGFS